MLDWLSEKAEKWARPADDTATGYYAVIAEASRRPGFYRAYGVDDSVDGRFDALVLHAVLVVRRLDAGAGGKGEGVSPSLSPSQGVLDTMFADLDLSLREMGVGETKIGKKVKTMATAWLGRMAAYSKGLDEGDRAVLAEALGRNLYRGNGADALANGLADAVLEAERHLKSVADADLAPETVAPVLARLAAPGGRGPSHA